MTSNIKIACLIGAAAGITPLLVSLVSVDAEFIVDVFIPKIFVGYLIKAIALMALGAFVVFVNSESDFKKAFQLGIMAPALVVGSINASNLSGAKQEISVLEHELNPSSSSNETSNAGSSYLFDNFAIDFSIIGNAYADSENNLIGKHNPPSTGRLVWYGLSGNISNGWFVMAGTHKQKSDADRQAQRLRNDGYDARVFPPLGNIKYFGVAIGSYLSIEEARSLRSKAIEGGLTKDSYLWKWK